MIERNKIIKIRNFYFTAQQIDWLNPCILKYFFCFIHFRLYSSVRKNKSIMTTVSGFIFIDPIVFPLCCFFLQSLVYPVPNESSLYSWIFVDHIPVVF